VLNAKVGSADLLTWILGLYTTATGSDYIDEQVVGKVFAKAAESLNDCALLNGDRAVGSLSDLGYLQRIPNSTTLYTTAKGKSAIRQLNVDCIGLDVAELQRLREAVLLEIATKCGRARIPEIVAGMKCQMCGRRSDNPITRKTCCVNKLYVFCSEACLQKWNRDWLRRQEQIATKVRSAAI